MNPKKARIIGFCIVILLVWAFVVYRLYSLQIDNNVNFQILANTQQGYSSAIQSNRGVITAADGTELAINLPLYDIYVYSPNITDLSQFENDFLPLVNYDKKDFEGNINAGIKYFKIGKNISPDWKKTLQDEIGIKNYSAIQFILNEQRFYPNDALLSHVLGFVSSGKGQYGIEGYYEGDLKGVNGSILGTKDQYGNPIINQNFNFIAPSTGEDITLTVDAHIQTMVEKKLRQWVDDEQANSGTVIIMDPKTGAIISMANYPTYDSNKYFQGYMLDCNAIIFKDTDACKDPAKQLDQSINASAFDNSAITFGYEPGSVFKAITASAALEEGKIDENTVFDDNSGFFEASGKKIFNYNKKPDGKMNIAEILKKSSNVGASMVSKLLGKDLMYKYYKAFGIGDPTGITLQGEQTGSVPDVSQWRDVDVATASFGQFTNATALQVIDVYQAIANKGIRMKPYIVKNIKKDGSVIDTQPMELNKVISEDTAAKLTKMLVYTTTGEPVWGLRNMKQYIPMIASKTGTAQIPLKDKAGYEENNINATYIGYAPANDPKFLMLLELSSPRAGIYSATTAVPAWADIAQQLFLYYKIPPQ